MNILSTIVGGAIIIVGVVLIGAIIRANYKLGRKPR